MRRVKECLLTLDTQHLDTVELANLSSGVEVQPSSTTGANLDVSGKCRVILVVGVDSNPGSLYSYYIYFTTLH